MSIYSIFEKLKNNCKKHQPINKIIVGLGNVGPKYENSRHNVGFKALDEISNNFGIELNKQKFKALIGCGYIEGINCLLMKPLTYMNNSGVSVELARDFYKLDINDIVVLSDDISLDIGKIRIRSKGS
ncbi:MAG: aminoacyl-tRNA hydrolase, partial [Oscillospiraceae bacterium]|nr:aminoacyl-tRNA hydrolase [Oscillospiraceae bacterium]